jgi:Na+-translocating ferredoxin:NAD+ oxidoreductase RnfE subunit
MHGLACWAVLDDTSCIVMGKAEWFGESGLESRELYKGLSCGLGSVVVWGGTVLAKG